MFLSNFNICFVYTILLTLKVVMSRWVLAQEAEYIISIYLLNRESFGFEIWLASKYSHD